MEKHRLRWRSKDETYEEVSNNDMRVFILLNGLPSDYKDTQRFLIATLLFMYGGYGYPSHFTNPTKSEMLK